MADGGIPIQERAAVGEGVRRDVDHAHDAVHAPTVPRIRRARAPRLRPAAARADADGMNIEAAAALQIQAMALVNARTTIERTQAQPLSAGATPAQHAEVILELSTAAQGLLSS